VCRIDYARLSEYFLDMAVVPAPLLRNRQGGIGYRVAPIAQLNSAATWSSVSCGNCRRIAGRGWFAGSFAASYGNDRQAAHTSTA